jgi:Predicted membrane protein (DUF2232).
MPDKEPFNLYALRDRLPQMPVPTAVTAILLVCIFSVFAGVMISSSPWVSLALTALSAAIFGVILILWRSRLAVIAVLVVSAGTAAVCFLTNNPTAALPASFFAAGFAPLGLTLSACVYGQKNCSSAILALSAVNAVWLAASIALFIAAGNSANIDFADFKNTLSEFLIQSVMSLSVESPDGTEMFFFARDAAAEIVRFTLLMSPGISAVTVMAVSALSAKAFYGFMRLFDITKLLPDPQWHITVKKSTAAVYCASYIAALLLAFSPGLEGIYYAAENIVLIFTFPLAIAGFGFIMSKTAKKLSPPRKLTLWIFIMFLLLANTSLILAIAAFFGVFSVFKKQNQNDT